MQANTQSVQDRATAFSSVLSVVRHVQANRILGVLLRRGIADYLDERGPLDSHEIARLSALHPLRQPGAIQLRYLQTLVEIGSEKNTTVVFPLPIDLLSSLGQVLKKIAGPEPGGSV